MSEPKIPGGYIMLSRKIIESEIMNKPPLYIKVWVYLLASAQHSDYRNLKRGQLVTSLPEIMEACSWMVGYRKVKPKKDQVYQVINWLRTVSRSEDESNYEGDTNATMITTTKATHGMLVNIENYDFYQTPANYESNSETYDENRTTTTRKQRQPNNINKNDKNDKKERKKDKDSRRKYDDDSPYIKMADYLLSKIREWKPDYVFRGNKQTWADDFRKMHELDKRSKEDIRDVIDWATQDSFWQANILSAKKLREKFDTLQAQMNRKVVPYKSRGGNQHAANQQLSGPGRDQSTGEEGGNVVYHSQFAHLVK